MSRFTLFQKRAIFSVAAAVVVHGCVMACWVLLLIWDLPIFSYGSPEGEDELEPEVVVVLRPFVERPKPEPIPKAKPKPETKPETKPKPKVAVKPPARVIPKPPSPPPKVVKAEPRKAWPEPQRKFARTSEEQAGVPDKPTDILGERDTLAASELPPTPGADPNKPSQDGANPLFPGQVETVTKKYKDGSVGMDKTGKETETPQEETLSRNDTPKIDAAPKMDALKRDTKDAARPKSKHLDIGELRPSTAAGKGKGKVEDEPKAKESPKDRPNRGENKDDSGKKVDQDPKKDGFSGYSRKNKVTGSISRKGKSSLNVKNSPLGRYQALVSKSVELQWRRNCERHRDHIVPGVISLRFYVDGKGKVSGIKFQEVVGANFIERGFTQRAIREAKLPKMSKSVVKELDGEPLELIYNFYF